MWHVTCRMLIFKLRDIRLKNIDLPKLQNKPYMICSQYDIGYIILTTCKIIFWETFPLTLHRSTLKNFEIFDIEKMDKKILMTQIMSRNFEIGRGKK